MALSILQAGIDRRVQSNTVNIDGKVKIHAVSDNILKNSKSLLVKVCLLIWQALCLVSLSLNNVNQKS